MVLKCRI